MIALKFDKLSKQYKSGFFKKEVNIAVDDVSFNVPKGSVFGLLGTNGAGKSSIIKMICGLLTPASGNAYVYGNSILTDIRFIKKDVGALLEGRRSLYWPMTVTENLYYFGRLKMMSSRDIKKRVEELIQLFEIEKYRNYEVGTLSNGNQQKVALAAAIIHSPKLLLLDEPTLGLDAHASIQLVNIIKQFVEDKYRTVFLTTHDLGLAQQLCDNFLILKNGQIDSQFDKSIFETYRGSVAFILDLNKNIITLGNDKVFNGLLLIEGVISYEALNDDRIMIVMKSTESLSKVLIFFEKCNYQVRDVIKKELTLQDIFLNLETIPPNARSESHLDPIDSPNVG